MTNPNISERVASVLVKTGAVSFRTDPFFTFTSGTKSPVYVDNRRLLGFVDERQLVVDALVERIVTDGRLPHAVAGTATAGIPWAAWIAERLGLPLVYVRAEAKQWGHARAVEGTAPSGGRVVVVEDLAFTATSLTTATENLRDVGYEVDGSVSIVSYQMPVAEKRTSELEIAYHFLTTVDEALRVAGSRGALGRDQMKMVSDWLQEQRGFAVRVNPAAAT